jgi:predicted transcriptional regulator
MTMHRIREVLRLKYECGLSHETIARALGIAKGSVANYVAAAQAAGLSSAGARELDDAALLERPARLIHWATAIGAATRSVVVHILESKPHPEQGYRACLGLLNLAKTYGPARLEAASARAVLIRSFSAKSVRSILQSGLDQQPVQKTLYAETPMPEHENVRGPKYYH